MINDFSMNKEQIIQIVGEIDDTRNTLADALQSLDETLARHRGCWGRDAPGKAFESSFAGPADDFVQDAAGTSAKITGLSGRLRTSAESFDTTDEENARKLPDS